MTDNQQSPKNWRRFFLGSYTPPEFMLIIIRFFTSGKFSALADKILGPVKNFCRTRRVLVFSLLGLAGVSFGVLTGLRVYESRKPQPISIRVSVNAPGNAEASREARPLRLDFYGSAAPVDMVDKEVSGGISINPPVKGLWRWEGDDSLVFTPEGPWPAGRRYIVSFDQDFFPPHIRVALNHSFSIEDFSISRGDAEFYIDPQDSSVKRVLASIRSNYPMDPASVEQNISIEPQIDADSGSLKKKRYNFTVSYNNDRTEAFIVSEALGMPARDVSMRISVKKGIRDYRGEGSPGGALSFSVDIPGMTVYVRVENFSHVLVKNDSQRYDQVFVLSTRGTISPAELAENISAWELPVDRPELPGLKAARNYSWNSKDMVTPEVLALSRKLELEAIPNELAYNAVNSYKFSSTPERYVYVKLNNGARFYGGYVLNESYDTIFRVKSYPKELAILSEGSILSFSGEKRLAMMSRGISSVRYHIGRIRPDDINHLASQLSGDMLNANFRNYSFNQYNITEQYEADADVPLGEGGDLGFFSFDFSRYLENIPSRNLRHGFFIFTLQGAGSNSSYSDRRLILVTNLGFFVKTSADGSRDLFIQSIATGEPVGGAAVAVLGLNGNPVFSGYSGADGSFHIPNLSEYENERAPTVYTVRSGEDMSFMPYSASGRSLDYSSFDVGGIRGAGDPKTLRAFLFSDRGLYRPGDEIRIGMAVKSGDWAVNLGGTPLEYTVTDPRGAAIYNKRISLSADGVEEIRFSTQDWSPTGTYTASVYVIRENRNNERSFLGSQTVKVEEFLPDTLNVSAVFAPASGEGALPQGGWISPARLKALVTVRNLFGSPAAGNEVKAQMNLSPGHQYFRQYRDYRFQDPYLGKNSYQEFLGTLSTDDRGMAEFDLDLAKFEKATYALSFYTEAFEKGSGRNVSAAASLFVSPLPWLVGYKADGSLSYIQRDSARKISLIAINPQAERTAVDDITLSLMELRYVSALVRQPNGVYKYQSIQKEYPVSSEKISIPAAGLDYSLPSGVPGEYRLVLTGPDELEYNRVAFTVAGTMNIQRSLNQTAELEISLNKNDFAAGETIELMIKAPYAGSGLITIERDRVYSHKWFRSSGETSTQTITVPPGLEGNGYINVQYLRSQNSPEIFMSPLSYGAVPFSISRESRTNRITLDIPGEAKPGKDFVIKYSSSRRGKIIIYAVDEGILQLAGYRTPDPLSFFFQKRALEVRTAQILDLTLPEYSVARSLAAMGGGEGYEELSRNLNPFKRRQNAPVAYWSGIIDSGPELREVSYAVPAYFNGSLRVMAVAVAADSLGAAEDRALLRSTFIISPNAPMMAAPGDEFEISLTVTNNQKGAGEGGQVHLKAESSPHLTLTNKSEFDLAIPEGRDETLSIPVKAAGPLGAAEIRFTASSGGEVSELAAYLSVRPASPYRVSLYSGVLKNKNAEITIDRRLYEEFHTREAALSYLPTGMARGLSFYLNTFPYGCSEQLTSAAFPFLYQGLLRDLGFSREEAAAGVNRVIDILQARMKDDGNIGPWTSRSPADPMVTIYAAHFLTEARNNGYYVAPAIMNRILQALRHIAEGGGDAWYSVSCRSYAIYVLTLNEVVTTTLIESLKKDMGKNNRELETGFPGLYLAGTYALLKKDSDASALLGRIKRTLAKDDSFKYIDELMYQALYLNITARHFPQRLRDISGDLFLSMAEQLEAQSYTTISASFALMAVDAYLKVVPDAETGNFAALEILKDKERRALKTAGTTLFTAPFSADAEKIRLENRDPLNLFYQISAGGFDLEPPKTEIKNGIEVHREFLNESGQVISSAKVGDPVQVKLSFRSLSGRDISSVAIVDLIPAGLEADIESVRQAESNSSWRPDYVDIREDRIVVYGTASSRVRSFTYRARAINSGSFTVPPLFAEAMYDKSVWAQRPQEALRISK
jgi:uncharacterized protein YfaS (alpha-2-macroglobulin family)